MQKTSLPGKPINPLLQVIRKFINKLYQNADIYPIRYYKKSRRFRRHWHEPIDK